MRQLALAYPGDARAVATDDEFLFGPDLLAAPVLEPGATERRLYLPGGRWIHLWDALRYRARDGGLRMGAARLVRGRRAVTVPAPLDELPLMARVGTILPLLTPEVDTLASDYEDPRSTSLAERSRRIVLLAFPHGRSGAGFFADERVRSRARRDRWTLRVRGKMKRTYELQASLAALRGRSRPCRVTVDGKRLAGRRWSYSKGAEVLRLDLRGRSPKLAVERRC
jgi:hypothetical protein